MTMITFSSVKYLGVTLDNTLSGDFIASNVIKKANGRLKFLYRHSNCLNFKSRKTLTSALIMRYFDYTCSCWYSDLSEKYKNQLQSFKIKLFVLRAEPRTHITHILAKMSWTMLVCLSSWDRVVQLKINHVLKFFHNLSPDYMKMYFTRVSSVHRYSSRGSPFNFIFPRSRGQTRFTFYNTAIHRWNSLPNEIKDIHDFKLFKKLIKKHLANHNCTEF